MQLPHTMLCCVDRGYMIIRLYHPSVYQVLGSVWETVRIFADKKPFTVVESYYTDAKFYIERVEKVHKPKAIIVLESNISEQDVAESSSSQKGLSVYTK